MVPEGVYGMVPEGVYGMVPEGVYSMVPEGVNCMMCMYVLYLDDASLLSRFTLVRH